MGNNPKRTLTFWRQSGLIPRPIVKKQPGKRGTKSYYPIDTIILLKGIRQAQDEGKNLSEIQQMINPQYTSTSNDRASILNKISQDLRDYANRTERRIAELEQENTMLKAENDGLIRTLKLHAPQFGITRPTLKPPAEVI